MIQRSSRRIAEEHTEDKVTACRLEYWIKQMTRQQKLRLIESECQK